MAAASQAIGRRSKWDQPGPVPGAAHPSLPSVPAWDQAMPATPPHRPSASPCGALDAAAAVAAKINAMLVAKGKLTPGARVPHKVSGSGGKVKEDLVVAEVEINDVDVASRNLLTRGHTQEEVSRLSEVAVSTRGRFMTPEEKAQAKPGERALYLHIQGQSRQLVDKAVNQIREMIGVGAGLRPNNSPSPAGTHCPPITVYHQLALPSPAGKPAFQPGMHYVQDKLFVGLEQVGGWFKVKERVEGPGGAYLQHIQSQTGAKVFLRGRGSGCLEPASGREAFEPMYIYISHPKAEGLAVARKLCESLLQTVHQESSRLLSQMTSPVQPTSGYQQMMGVNGGQYYASQGFNASYPTPSTPPTSVTSTTHTPSATQASALTGYPPIMASSPANFTPSPAAPAPPTAPGSGLHSQAHKRRFTEATADQQGDLLGYQHGSIPMTHLGADPRGRGLTEALTTARPDRHTHRQPAVAHGGGGAWGGARGPLGGAASPDRPPVVKMRKMKDCVAKGDGEREREDVTGHCGQGGITSCRYSLPPSSAKHLPFWMAP